MVIKCVPLLYILCLTLMVISVCGLCATVDFTVFLVIVCAGFVELCRECNNSDRTSPNLVLFLRM